MLNSEQKQAVEYIDSPLLILAGAGSGKTKVLTEKIAYLIKNNLYQSHEILAITFTNKAAKEMKNRALSLLPKGQMPPYIGTFHSFCLHILRKEFHHLDRPVSFVILDQSQQLALLTTVCNKLNLDAGKDTVRNFSNHISKLKNAFILPSDYAQKSSHDIQLLDIYTLCSVPM